MIGELASDTAVLLHWKGTLMSLFRPLPDRRYLQTLEKMLFTITWG
jgi:hypothetical protein